MTILSSLCLDSRPGCDIASKRATVLNPSPWSKQFFFNEIENIVDKTTAFLIANGYPPFHELVRRLQQLDDLIHFLAASKKERSQLFSLVPTMTTQSAFYCGRNAIFF